MCEIVQLVTHLGITATKRIHKVNMHTQETVYVKKNLSMLLVHTLGQDQFGVDYVSDDISRP